jgi:hypothetical protein
MVEKKYDSSEEEEGDFDFDEVEKEAQEINDKNEQDAIEGVMKRQSYFKGNTGPHKILEKKKDLMGEGADE